MSNSKNMTDENKKTIAASVSMIGPETKAAVVITVTHDKQIAINYSGELIDLSFMLCGLQNLINETLSGRFKYGQNLG